MAPFFPSSTSSSSRQLQQFCTSAMITYNHSGLSLQNIVRLKDHVIIAVFKFNFKYIYVNSYFEFNYKQVPHCILYNLIFICCVFGTSYSARREISHVRKYRWPFFMCLRYYCHNYNDNIIT